AAAAVSIDRTGYELERQVADGVVARDLANRLDHPALAKDEGNSREPARRLGERRESADLGHARAGRLLHGESDAELEQSPADLGHVAVPAEHEDEVGLRLLDQLPPVRERRATGTGCRGSSHCEVWVRHPHDL